MATDSGRIRRRRRRRAIEAPVLEDVLDKLDKAWLPKEIHEALGMDERFTLDQVPSVRTIQRIAADHAPSSPDETWDLRASDPDDSALVVEALRDAYRQSEGRVRHFTRAEAEWVVRVKRARPDFSPWLAYRFARRYLARMEAGEPTGPLDLQLARLNPIGEGMPDEQLERRAAAQWAHAQEVDDEQAE